MFDKEAFEKERIKIEEKWKKVWTEKNTFVPKIEKERKKFFITVPFPYTNGALHTGHGRTFITADFISRFMKKKGIMSFGL